jgi:hypothetical protein
MTRFEELGCEMESFKYCKCLGVTDDSLPCIVEVAFAWRPDRDRRLITGINWSPGILNPFRTLGGGQSLDSVLEQQRSGCDEEIVCLVHVTCPRVQYTDRGKASAAFGSLSTSPEED